MSLREGTPKKEEIMLRSMRKFIQSLVFLVVLTAGCRQRGSEFAGKWVNSTDPCDTIEITRNDQQFFVGKAPATYKDDGTLQFPFTMGGFLAGVSTPVTVTYVKSSDTLILVGVPLSGQQEYKRDHSSESPISSSDFVGKWAGQDNLGRDSTVEIAQNGEQFLLSYSLPLWGSRTETSRYTFIFKDDFLKNTGPNWVIQDGQYPDTMLATYVSCANVLVLR
jgi:hypothetical protein